jgi:predicted regulator of Ras-like GTPase activity (Roadblock/LC7/MglB family)
VNNDLAWMLDRALEVPEARHALLVSADGLLMARSREVDRDDADTVAAAMSGMQSLSRTLGGFAGGEDMAWRQTLVEFDGGWVFLISSRSGSRSVKGQKPLKHAILHARQASATAFFSITADMPLLLAGSMNCPARAPLRTSWPEMVVPAFVIVPFSMFMGDPAFATVEAAIRDGATLEC